MTMIVVGGTQKGAGKTSLICGLLAALPRYAWVTVKVTTHSHGDFPPIWEELSPGQGTDTARYLHAGARRAFLVTAAQDELPDLLDALGKRLEPGDNVIFESNRILAYVRPDLCLTVAAAEQQAAKPSFELASRHEHARVISGDHDAAYFGERLVFQLAKLDRISPVMQSWLQEHLTGR
ncbi:MAG TPA: hypothetical protein VFI20_01485 [Terracidiphilus sp.]|nr:hypothetical protein [Terracidiphilus sp.]